MIINFTVQNVWSFILEEGVFQAWRGHSGLKGSIKLERIIQAGRVNEGTTDSTDILQDLDVSP